MMTERQKQMIEAYIPSPRDETLDISEYYIRDDNDKIQKVYISEINPGGLYENSVYGVRYSSNGNRFCGGLGYGQTHMWDLYDNKDDCRDMTHAIYDGWEELRRIQNESND